MLKKFLRKSLIIFLCQALIYAPLIRAEQLSLPSGDLVAPKISQEKYIDKVEAGADHEITVTVTDNVGVNQVILYYRAIGTEKYIPLAMNNVANTDNYHATLTSDKIKAPGVEYYVQAVDNAGNSVLHGYSFSPLSVKTDTSAAAIAAASGDATINTEESSNTWLWIGLGALAVVVAVAAGGGGGGGDNPPTTAALNIDASNPNQ